MGYRDNRTQWSWLVWTYRRLQSLVPTRLHPTRSLIPISKKTPTTSPALSLAYPPMHYSAPSPTPPPPLRQPNAYPRHQPTPHPHYDRRRKADESPGGPRDIAFKLAMDRFVLTPPYLVITFAGLGLLQGFGVERSMREAKGLYFGALATNWTVRFILNGV